MSALAPHAKRFSGKNLLYRKRGEDLRNLPSAKAVVRDRPPRKRHLTFEAAEAEAGRLLGLFPQSTFVIIQEVARVKLKPAEARDG